MRAQRPRNLAAAIDAVAENLPFADDEFEASMATFTIHQWTDLERGLREMRRVTRGTIILLTCDPQLVQRFWLNDYAPDVLATEARRYPSMTRIREALGERIQEIGIPIPLDCKDGFNEAYYGRPERLLDDDARLACSAWSLVSAEVCDRYVDHLRRDLRTGAWDSQFRHLRGTPFYDGALRLIVATS
jgi:SAM-dependent methyltransferase